ncbi:hypothetical protein LSHI6S_01001 [Leifsonia shinshuensis]
MIPLSVRASCASPPPSGQECHDTVALTGTMPSWLPLAILAALVLIGVVIALVRTRARRL